MKLGRQHQRGALLLEALVAILICAFGLLGFAGLQARAISAELESYQRSQALVLIEDIASRINANRTNASAYVSGGLIGGGAVVDCSAMTGANLDLCEWGNLLRGASEVRGGSSVGSMFNARGCITKPTTSTDRYVISIAWIGVSKTGAPASDCGKGDAGFPTESLRRVVSSTVCMGRLIDPAVAPAIPRC
jgi:type IV pilus assembly protein PilV